MFHQLTWILQWSIYSKNSRVFGHWLNNLQCRIKTVLLLWCLSTDCSADHLEYAKREQTDRHSRSLWFQWFLYLLHHLHRGRSWSGERQRRSPRWKCRLWQLATTDDNNDRQQPNNMVVKTQCVCVWSGATRWDKKSRTKKKDEREEQEEKRQKWAHSKLAEDLTGNKEATEDTLGQVM